MSLAQPYRQQSGHFRNDCRSSYGRNQSMASKTTVSAANYNYDTNFYTENHDFSQNFAQNFSPDELNYNCAWPYVVPSSKRRKISDFSCENTGPYQQHIRYESGLVNHANQYESVPSNYPYAYSNVNACVSATSKRDRSIFEDEEVVFMSKDEIDRCSPSRKDGIDALQEEHLRYSYCAFLQSLGARLDLPQTTIGTAMVLCHRFFVRRSHASHDRFLVATSALFLASKSEETSRPLNDVLKASCEIFYKQDFTLLSFMLPIDWFEQYRERITDAEQLLLTTLNFELNVQHPYESLTSTLQKLGFSQSVLVNLAMNLVGEGLRSSLWLQFKPHQIAAGAAYLAAKFLNMNLDSCHYVWREFHTPPPVLKDVAHQLMKLF